MLWLLYVAVALAVVGAVWLLVDAPACPDSDNGEHYDLWCFDDTGGRWRVFHRCLHCLRETHGWAVPWIRHQPAPEGRR